MAVASVEASGIKYALSYELLHPEKSECVLILHGWGANKELMKQAFVSEFTDFCHIYLDLCGFGKSSIEVPLKSKKNLRHKSSSGILLGVKSPRF